jgi:hypothetical protein
MIRDPGTPLEGPVPLTCSDPEAHAPEHVLIGADWVCMRCARERSGLPEVEPDPEPEDAA